MVFLYYFYFVTTLGEELVVVEVAIVARDAVVAAHVDGLYHFLTCDEGFVELLAMACANDLDFGLTVLRINFLIGLLEGFGKDIEGRSWCLLNEEVAILSMGEGIDNEIYGIIEGHHEAGHFRIGDGDRLTLHHLLYPERNDGTTACHHVAVTG